ncbi:MAG: Wzz/FepE/Etk N-terminal domain-containing protein [Pisciglobus halotolerans]|nr:Wzz/FepE/Etk N-terminal domain-containing protein [Pisciglobus halotolerans]
MNKTIGILDLLTMLKKKWYILVLLAAIGIGAAYVVSTYFLEAQYTSTTKLLVSRKADARERVDLTELQTNVQMINTYTDIIQDPLVLDKVSQEMNGELSEKEILGKIDIDSKEESQIFGITVVDNSPKRAAKIADLVALSFRENANDVVDVESISILSPAKVNLSSIFPNVLLNEVIGAFIGILAGGMIVLVMETADKKVRNEAIIKEKLGWNHLGTITSMNEKEVADSLDFTSEKTQQRKEIVSKDRLMATNKTATTGEGPNHV